MADKIVSTVENRLEFDESSWDTLIEALCRSDGGVTLARRLTDQLRVKLSGENAHAASGKNFREQRQNRDESPVCSITNG